MSVELYLALHCTAFLMGLVTLGALVIVGIEAAVWLLVRGGRDNN